MIRGLSTTRAGAETSPEARGPRASLHRWGQQLETNVMCISLKTIWGKLYIRCGIKQKKVSLALFYCRLNNEQSSLDSGHLTECRV